MTDHTTDRAIVDAATQGDWEKAHRAYVIDQDNSLVCHVLRESDATHIAHFDPPKVRALLDEIAELRAMVVRNHKVAMALDSRQSALLVRRYSRIDLDADAATIAKWSKP